MTAAEFEAIRPLLNISHERIDAARAALVDGVAQQTVAVPFGWTRQAVHDAVTVVWNTLVKYREGQSRSTNASVLLPPGWELVTLIAPSSLIEKFRIEIAAYANEGNIGIDSKGKSKRPGTRCSR
jgi:hypothetical protein